MYLETSGTDRVAVCGESLRPISDQEWICVARAAHDDDHVAGDGTRW